MKKTLMITAPMTAALVLLAATSHGADDLFAQTATLLPPPAVKTVAATAAGDTIEVPVLAHDVTSGAVISENDLTTAQVPARNVFNGTVHSADEVVGKQATKNMAAGEPLLKMRLKTASDVARDSVVQLIFKRPGLELTGQAKALQDGKVGESIRVMNPETKAMLLATITAPGQVEVR